MNLISRKIHLYNVTMGLYMLDWWERYLFMDALMLVLLWFIFYNGSRSATEFYSSFLKPKLFGDHVSLAFGGNMADSQL